VRSGTSPAAAVNQASAASHDNPSLPAGSAALPLPKASAITAVVAPGMCRVVTRSPFASVHCSTRVLSGQGLGRRDRGGGREQ